MPLLILGMAALVVVVWVAGFPALGAYMVTGLTPLLAGIDRGLLIPLIRPNEAVILLAAAGLGLGGLVRLLGKRPADRVIHMRLHVLDGAVTVLTLASSIIPLLWMIASATEITRDDILYALVPWKLLAVYAIVRVGVRREREVRICLSIALGAASIVALIGILQALKLFGVPNLLATYYAPFGKEQALQINRGGSTLALPVAVADLLVFNLAAAGAFLLRGGPLRPLLVGITGILVLGVLASGQLSGAIALVVGATAFLWLAPNRKKIVKSVTPALLLLFPLGAILIRPVLQSRLQAVNPVSGMPVSWEARLYNLRTYFWPELFTDWNYLMGVQVSARRSTSEYEAGYVWIESGYTALLWTGGLPLLLAFFLFVATGLKQSSRVVQSETAAYGVAATASFVALCVISVGMLLDPHLTYRGSGDLLFTLLALAAGATTKTGVGPAKA